MSGANGAVADVITLDELEQLIKFLGLLGSSHDGEALNAARFAARWVVKHGTDFRTLLTPEEEVGVVGVVATADQDAEVLLEARLNEAYRNGVRDGMGQMAAQLKAQAAYGGLGQAQGPWNGLGAHPAQNVYSTFSTGLGAGLGGLGAQQGAGQATQAFAAQAPSQGPRVATPGAMRWQDVAQELLDRHAQGIPGVFRGTREEQFVSDVLKRGFRTLTQAQEVWLRDIAGRSGMSW